MSILFSFCDVHWIFPWLLPFILGWFFGSRLLGGYKNRIRDLESTQLREQKRFEALETDLNQYKAKAEETNALASESSFSFDEERASYKQEIADLNQRLQTAQVSESQRQPLMDTTSESEVNALKSRIEELETDLANEKNRPSKSTDEAFADVAPGESSGLSSGITQAPQLASMRTRIAELEAELAATDSEGLRSKLTAVEAELALEKGKAYEQAEVKSEEAPMIAQLRNKLLQTEAELALSKGGGYEQAEKSNENTDVAALRNKLLQTEAELALLKGSDYERKESGESSDVTSLQKKISKLEKSLALQKGYNSIAKKKTALAKKKNSGKKAKKTKAKQVSAKTTKKKKQKTGTKSETKKSNVKSTSKKAKKTVAKSKAKSTSKKATKTATKSKAKTGRKSTKKGKAATIAKLKKYSVKARVPSKAKSKAKAGKASAKKTSQPAKSAKFSNVKAGDLTIIEGIGPKAAALLKRKGIKNFSDLAAKTPGQLKELLASQKGLSHIDPSTWTRQAKLASGGHWTRLANLQDDLQGGKATKKSTKRKAKSKTKSSKKSTKKAEPLNIQVNSKLKKTNYQLIEGVGLK